MQNLNSIPLSALRTIEAIVRHGTLRGAAEELGVTAGALSQRLAKAEAALGSTLFVRNSTGLKPTELCKKVAPRLTASIVELSRVVSELQTPEKDTLTVAVAPVFASRWLIWRIGRFNQSHPQICLRVLPGVEIVDLDYSNVDVGIRVGEDPELGVGATKLLDQRVFPVCSPELSSHIATPEDLFELPVIRENERLYGWKAWLLDSGFSQAELRPGPTYADASLCLDAAMTGQGVFMAWETLACDALEQGHLCSPFDIRSKTGATYWLATRKGSQRNPSVAKFKSWLKAELECSLKYWNTLTSVDG